MENIVKQQINLKLWHTLLLLCLCLNLAHAKRVALLIGNDAYPTAALQNPVNDATDLAGALRELDFEVIIRTNVQSKSEFRNAVINFRQRLSPDDIALFYFSGHGAQIDKFNYLIPTQASFSSLSTLEDDSVSADYVLREISSAGASTNILILDACRNLPNLPTDNRAVTKGLADMKRQDGTIIAFAATPGEYALDSLPNQNSRNSPYVHHLKDVITRTELDLVNIFQEVQIEVSRSTNGEQKPESINRLYERVYLGKSNQDSQEQIQTKIPLSVDSNPRGANVSLDGIIVGTTPFSTELGTGTYQIEISLIGYEIYRESVNLNSRKDLGIEEAGKVYKDLILLQSVLAPSPAPRMSDGTIPITRNIDWTPVKQDFNGTTMVLVPAGNFKMGSTEKQVDEALVLCNEGRTSSRCLMSRFEDETPLHTQSFAEPFWIDETEVTRGAYKACVSSGGCADLHKSVDSTTINQPMNVAWYQAAGYCKWRGVKLPTEAEWEYAARGPDSLIYPWGNEFDGNKVHHSSDKTGNVGSYPSGASWVGALDMSGNIYEWTSSLHKGYPYIYNDGNNLAENETYITEEVILRGGSYHGSTDSLRAAFRYRASASSGGPILGFRCSHSNSAP